MPASRPARFRYICEDDHTGYGNAAHALVGAVRREGVPVEYLGWAHWLPGYEPATKACTRDTDVDRVAPAGAPTVAHLVPEHYPYVREVVGAGPLVGHTVWETDRLPRHWPALLNQADHLMVPTEWNRKIFLENGVTVPISVVPHIVVDPTAGGQGAGSLAIDIDDETTVFSVVGRWDRRKDHERTIEAYLRAFTGDDPVLLVVKVDSAKLSWFDSTPVFDIARLVGRRSNPADVHLAVDTWSAAQMAALHARTDCHVMLSHGEGWGLTLSEAVASGCPVITTGWGAPVEWMGTDVPALVDYELASVDVPGSESYTDDQRWAVADTDHAVELLREVAADPAAARERWAPVRERVLTECSPSVVARRCLAVIDEVS